jgi:hypothetical protein
MDAVPRTVVELVDEGRSVLGREHYYKVVLPGGGWTWTAAERVATDLVYERAVNLAVRPLGYLRGDVVKVKL